MLTVVDDDGATGFISDSVLVELPEPPLPEPNELPLADFNTKKTSLSAVFTDASTDADGVITGWSWDFGDGAGSSEQNPTHVFARDGFYRVSLTVTDDRGGTASITKKLRVKRRGRKK